MPKVLIRTREYSGGMGIMDKALRKFNEISVEEIQEGMKLAEDILNSYGNILIPAGSRLRDIEKLKSLLEHHNVRTIRIIEELTEEEMDFPNPWEIEEAEEIRLQEEVISFREGFKETHKKIQRDFEKILKGEELKQQTFEENINKTLEVFKGSINVFQLLEKIKDFDDITYAHSQNVALISYAIGKWLDLKEEQLQNLMLSALLIDIGKMQISTELLNKKEPLTHDEKLECQKHAIYSHELIKKYPFINEEVKQAVLLHHERMDGSGYPMGLKGEKIPILARIIAIADVYSALTSERPYRSKKTPFEAIKILESEYLNKLDSKILYIFLRRIGNCFIGQEVKLKDGRVGKIVFVPQQNIHRPIIKLNNSNTFLDLNQPQFKHLEIEDFN